MTSPTRIPAAPTTALGASLPLVLAGALALHLAGCGGGGASGGFAPPVEPVEAPFLSEGEVVAHVRVEVPDAERFVLRATLPVPRDTFPRGDGRTPFAVRNADGGLLPTQVETVTRYASSARGADVVEVSARVQRPPDAPPGSEVDYEVVSAPRTPGTFAMHWAVRELAGAKAPVVLCAEDAFGNVYEADLSRSTSPITRLKDGAVMAEWRTSNVMLPVAPNGTTLPHLFGVHAYFRVYEGEPVVELDLRVYNGFTGRLAEDPTDDPLGDVYFRGLELRLPGEYVVHEDFDSYQAGPNRLLDGASLYPVVRPRADGRMHFVPHQGQLVRRLDVARLEHEDTARRFAQGFGRGFARPGHAADGRELFSWWSPLTARYYPQRHRLPELDHLDLDGVRSDLAARLQRVETGLRLGGAPGYPVEFPALGWAHPWGLQESGQAGGSEIFLFDGVRTAATASRAGLRLHQLKFRMYTDRHETAFYDADGGPIDVDDWLVVGPQGRWVPFLYFGVPLTFEFDPFGIGDSPSFQREFVESQGLAPPYRDTLAAFLPIDLEHLVRYTNPAKVLVWLSNDSLAKDALRMEAAAFRAGYHEYPLDAYDYYITTGLGHDLAFTAEHPGQGMSFGRLEGWGIDACNAVYAFGSDGVRARMKPWYDKILTAVERGQSDCLGIIQADLGDQFFDGTYRTRQSIEQAIVESALMSVVRGVYADGVDPENEGRLSAVLVRSFYSMVEAPAWDYQRHGPVAKLAVGGHTVEEGLFCAFPPPDGRTPFIDSFQTWSSFAYARRLTGDPLFFRRAGQMAGGGDLLARMRAMGTENLENRAALLADVQRP